MISEKEMLNKLLSTIKTDLNQYPRLDSSLKMKYALKNIYYRLSRQDQVKLDRYSWPNAMMAWAIIEQNSSDGLVLVQTYLDRWIETGQKIHTVDNLMNGMSLLILFDKTGNQKYKIALDKLVDFALSCKKSTEGSIPYRQKNTEAIYVDAIGILCPFLFRYARRFHQDNIRDLAMIQIQSFIDHGIDASTGLPVHGYLADTKIKLGVVGWGRGTGWYLCGLSECLDTLDKGSDEYQVISKELVTRLEIVLKYQYPDGFFCWQLGLNRGQNDSSATFMILYAATKAVGQGLLKAQSLHESFERGLNALRASLENGKVTNCSAECGGFSIYPQIYGTYPWATTPAFAFLSLLAKITS